jgi:hypothetical protein
LKQLVAVLGACLFLGHRIRDQNMLYAWYQAHVRVLLRRLRQPHAALMEIGFQHIEDSDSSRYCLFSHEYPEIQQQRLLRFTYFCRANLDCRQNLAFLHQFPLSLRDRTVPSQPRRLGPRLISSYLVALLRVPTFIFQPELPR